MANRRKMPYLVLAVVLSFSLLFSAVLPAFSAPNVVRVEQSDGSAVEYNVNAAVDNPALLSAMNAALGNAFETGKKIVGQLLSGKLVDVNEALEDPTSYEAYEEAVVSGEKQETADLVATVEAVVDEDGKVVTRPKEGPPGDLVVTSVSAIDKTIELNVASFEAEEGATAKVAIFALDDEGVKTGTAMVTANTAEIVDNVVTFDVSSKTFGDDEYVVEVTIGEETQTVNVALEFDAVEELVKAINNATAAQLATLLADETYFTGFDVAKVDDYNTNNTKNFKTVAEVQENVIDAVAANAEFDAFVEELTDAEKGEYAKYLVLKGQFSNVLDANMDAYMVTGGVIFGADLDTAGSATSFDDISDAIDQVNLDAVVAGDDGIVFGSIDGSKPSELNAYKSALEALVLVNDEVTDTNGDTKAEIIEAIDAELEAIADAREAADAEIVKAETAMAAFVTAYGSVPAETDVPEYDAVVAEIAELQKEDLAEASLSTDQAGELEALVTALEAETEELTIIEDTLAALAEFEAAFEVNNTTAANLETEYTNVTANFTDFDNEDYSYASGKTITTLKADLVTLKAETAEWETYNAVVAAKTATEMRGLLFEFGNSDYVNLTSAQKLEFAEMFIAAVAEDESVDYAAINTLLGTEVTAYTALIDAVNVATTISGMTTALEAISEDYDALGAQVKADIAEAVLAGVPYATIADIVAAMGL